MRDRRGSGSREERWGRLEAEGPSCTVLPAALGVVLGRGGRAIGHMLLPFLLGLGAPIGSGHQFFPWIHIRDLAGILAHALEASHVQGVLTEWLQPPPLPALSLPGPWAQPWAAHSSLSPAQWHKLALGENVPSCCWRARRWSPGGRWLPVFLPRARGRLEGSPSLGEGGSGKGLRPVPQQGLPNEKLELRLSSA